MEAKDMQKCKKRFHCKHTQIYVTLKQKVSRDTASKPVHVKGMNNPMDIVGVRELNGQDSAQPPPRQN